MKNENNRMIMTEFVGLRSKMYATRVHGIKHYVKKLKGIGRSVTEKSIQFDVYIKCLNDSVEKTVQQNRIKSIPHNVYTIHEQKLALSPHDKKRKIQHNSTRTLPWGHYSIRETSHNV
ncbi:hypothetical protein WN55_06588 [Dufourea novaeangliae]|uniref:Uncharacterized protein n=1 Tax=Dufourea novaeangliae TaxID=178035 RepID=A0A154P0A4_DUFNO|nr:hypothetical protein WN55_06588 [Dufourea novaeangliae]